MVSIFLMIAALLVVVSAEEEMCNAKHTCKLESLGCFDDNYHRALPELLLNERDVASKYSNGMVIDWFNFEKYLKDFACRCARKAYEKNYNIIGLQFFGECWSGANGQDTYDKFGRSTNCIDGRFGKYVTNSSTCMHYVGRQWTNHVYRIATPGCNQNFEPVGCFHDDLVRPRPVPHYIASERDYSHPAWNGHLIDWKDWKKYSTGLICRCAQAASEKGHLYFAIQFWGECWSGTHAEVRYARNGSSKNCRNEYFSECTCNSYNCVGMAYNNYVYKINKKIPCSRGNLIKTEKRFPVPNFHRYQAPQ